MGQVQRPGPQVLVFTSLTRFSSLSNFAISTAGPFCTSWPFFSWGEEKYTVGRTGEGEATSRRLPASPLQPSLPQHCRALSSQLASGPLPPSPSWLASRPLPPPTSAGSFPISRSMTRAQLRPGRNIQVLFLNLRWTWNPDGGGSREGGKPGRAVVPDLYRSGPPFLQEGLWLSPNEELRCVCLWRESVDKATGGLTQYSQLRQGVGYHLGPGLLCQLFPGGGGCQEGRWHVPCGPREQRVLN